MRRRSPRFVALCLSTLLAGCSGSPAPTPTPAPTRPPTTIAATYTVAGHIVEKYAGVPLAGVELSLEKMGKDAAHAKTGADGRFVFESLPPGLYTVKRKVGEKFQPIGGQGYAGYLNSPPPSGDVTVAVDDGPAVEKAFGPACVKGKLGDLKLPGRFLFLRNKVTGWSDATKTELYRGAKYAKSLALVADALICIDESTQMIGRYGIAPDAPGAFRTTWKVRAIRVDNGKVASGSFTAEPPKQMRMGDPFVGDPDDELLAWLPTAIPK